jgi:DNA-directed RNA polymerase subunit RPC12/RpoP
MNTLSHLIETTEGRSLADEVQSYIVEMVKRLPAFLCPHCGNKIARKAIQEFAGKLGALSRTTFKGRERTIYRCGCGELFSAREIRKHRCPQKPPKGQEKLATKQERAQYFARLEQ